MRQFCTSLDIHHININQNQFNMNKLSEANKQYLYDKQLNYIYDHITTGLEREKNGIDYMNAYQRVFTIIDNGECHPQEAIDFYLQQVQRYLNYAAPKITEAVGDNKLEEYIKCFNNTTLCINWLQRIFNFIDNTYISSIFGAHSLIVRGLEQFKNQIFDNFIDSILDEIFMMIQKEREGIYININTIKETLKCLRVTSYNNATIECINGKLKWKRLAPILNMHYDCDEDEKWYENHVEIPYLNKSEAYYRGKTLEWFLKKTAIEYLYEIERVIDKETSKPIEFFSHATRRQILSMLHEELIHKYAMKIVEKDMSGLHYMLKNSKRDDI